MKPQFRPRYTTRFYLSEQYDSK